MCTGIGLVSQQGHPFWGRTQDFEQHFEYAGVKIHGDMNLRQRLHHLLPSGMLWELHGPRICINHRFS